MTEGDIFYGEDTITALCASKDIQNLAEHMRSSGPWEEVVPGMADITVKYNPDKLTSEDALNYFEEMLGSSDAGIKATTPPSLISLTASFDEECAPDSAMVAETLGIAIEDLPHWLSKRRFRVSMMGFQPGFAYLKDGNCADLPIISRLETPRPRVAAGSIGFLGGKACIYALDGPGGWPIIGKINQQLFDPDKPKNPALLSPGQQVRFANGD